MKLKLQPWSTKEYLKEHYMSIFLFALFLVIFILYTVYVWFTPLYNDDFIYEFYGGESYLTPYYHKIPLVNLYTDNFSHVSRFVPHLIIGGLHLVGKPLFNLLAGFVFILFGFFSARLVTDYRSKIPSLTMISCSLIFLMVKGFFFVGPWLSGSPNYLYVAILISIYILLLRRGKPLISNKIINFILMFLFGWIVGWTNEGFIVGLVAAVLIYYCFIKRKELNLNRKALIIGLFIGCCFLCLSPYNILKFALSHVGHYSEWEDIWVQLMISASRITMFRATMTLFVCAIVLCLILFVGLGRKNASKLIKGWFKDNLMIIIAFIVSFLFVTSTLFDSNRARFPTEFYAIILLLSLLAKLPALPRFALGTLGGILTIICLADMLPLAKINYDSWQDMERQIKAGNEQIITKTVPVKTSWQRRYVNSVQNMFYPYHSLYLKDARKYYDNISISNIIDEGIYNAIAKNHIPYKGYYKKEWEATYIKIPEDKDVTKVKVKINQDDCNSVTTPLQNLGIKLDKLKYINRINKDAVITYIDGEKWLVVPDIKYIAGFQKKIEITVKDIDPERVYNPLKVYGISNKVEIMESD